MMPFDGSGNFTRVRSWVQDRDNGIHITADRHDTEDDNLAAGLNLTFLRSGLVPMGGNLPMGGNYMTGLGAGSVGAPSIRFNDDATSGIFLNGVGNLCLVAGGTTRVAVSATGVAVTGTLSATGAITQAGNQVWHAGNFDKTLYATNINAVFTTAVNINSAGDEKLVLKGSSAPYIGGYNTGGTVRQGYLQFGNAATVLGSDTGAVTISTATTQAQLNGTGFVIAGALSATGAITQNGSQVWHAGNFDKTLYALLNSSPTFTGGVTATSFITPAGVGRVSLIQGSAPNTGYIEFKTAGDVRQHYIGFSGTGGALQFISDIGAGFTFNAPVAVSSAFNATGAITQAGNQVWHAGNFNSALYAPLASPAFTGTASVPGGEIGTRDLPQTAIAAAFAFLAAHRGGHIRYTGAAAAATINTNATTALPIGTAIVVVNTGSGALTFTRAGGVSLNWNGADANRVLAVGGMATLLKVDTDTWFISGTLLS